MGHRLITRFLFIYGCCQAPLYVHHSIYQSVHLCISWSIHPWVHPSIHPSIHPLPFPLFLPAHDITIRWSLLNQVHTRIIAQSLHDLNGLEEIRGVSVNPFGPHDVHFPWRSRPLLSSVSVSQWRCPSFLHCSPQSVHLTFGSYVELFSSWKFWSHVVMSFLFDVRSGKEGDFLMKFVCSSTTVYHYVAAVLFVIFHTVCHRKFMNC